MGSVAKVFKKATKVIKKPISKITKGIARGIAKVGKAVMRGVSKVSNKLGPVGMIGLSIAMPYALGALGGGTSGGLIGLQGGSTGWMNSTNTFLRSIGNVGNAIRTGYQAGTGAIGKTWSTITKSISNGFQKFSGGQGNIWTRISNGAKKLYTSAKNTVKKFTPKFKAAKTGSVNVYGDMGEVITMSAEEAQKRILAGTLDASQLSGQTLGSETAGWFTKGQTSTQISANDLVTETINNGLKDQVNMLDGTAQRVFNDHVAHQKFMGSYINNTDALNSTMNSKGIGRSFATDFSTEPTSFTMDLSKNPDYKLGVSPNEQTTYTFTGDKTYNNNIGKSSIKEASKNKLKNKVSTAAKGYATSLLKKNEPYKIPEVMYASNVDMTTTTGANYSGTDIEGSSGGSLLEGAFNDAQREKIMTFYRNMNIMGSS
tara:strand:+ start:1105 stop:2391 length:1287 start_codon:yes stop_codon:yes gene_type:complete